MLHRLLIWIFNFCLLIELTYSFRTFKHDIAFYYKTHASVSLTNPDNHTTSYGIYVAGQTITIDIPTSVVNVSEILDWKVVNINEKRLMFVHNKKPQILINQQRIKQMNYSGELSDSIIAFGDNEALHVPTIFNPNLTKPVHTWNYIELLHFDDENEKVSVIRSLPWSQEEDWKQVKEWKMTDYIHFDGKLYLLIKRTIARDNPQSFTQEISIIQMCIDQGSELISSFVEIGFIRPELQTNQIIDLIFVFIFGPLGHDRYQLHTTQLQPNNTKIYQIYSIRDIVSLFEETLIEMCGSRSRSEVTKCKTTSYESCLASKNVGINVTGYKNILDIFLHSVANDLHKLQFFTLPHPYYSASLFIHTKPIFYTIACEYTSAPLDCINYGNSINSGQAFAQAHFHVNKHPLGIVYVTKETNQFVFGRLAVCEKPKTCTECIMYGFYLGCIWSNSICKPDDQPRNKATQTINHCFKVINISPLMFNSSLPRVLTIELDRPLNVNASQEQLVIQAGDNHCTDITMNGAFINCLMALSESGEFTVDVSLRNDRYADAAILSSASTDKVHISVPDSEYDFTFIVILFLLISLLISSFIFIVRTKYKNKYVNRFKKFSRTRKANRFIGAQSAITRVRSKILSSTMNTITDSTVTNAPSSKQVSLWSSMRSVPDHLYLSKQLYSSRLK
uniref:Sema domain-containing protein n=1 Tax=Tetranychus urticae TaxID=32264 RepID=A0A158P4U4_TETUR